MKRELTSNEGICKWTSINDMCNLEMPYTSKYVMEHYYEIGRFTTDMYVGVSDGDKVEFVKIPEY